MASCVASCGVLTAVLLAAKPGKEGLVVMAQHLFCTLPGHKGWKEENQCLRKLQL